MFGLSISLGKTEVLQPAAPNRNTPEPTAFVDGTQLKNVDNFKHLGSSISSNGSLDREITSGINKASQALRRLHTRMLNQDNIRLSMKLKVYSAVVLSSLLCRCED